MGRMSFVAVSAILLSACVAEQRPPASPYGYAYPPAQRGAQTTPPGYPAPPGAVPLPYLPAAPNVNPAGYIPTQPFGAGATAEPGRLAGITAAHNQARASIATTPAIAPVSWSPELAASAQAVANRCVFEHSRTGHGENLYAATNDVSSQTVVASWMSERRDYDEVTHQCSGVCGHFTQVVWRSTQRIGCGVARCAGSGPFSGFDSWEIWVCQYDPPGNQVRSRPY